MTRKDTPLPAEQWASDFDPSRVVFTVAEQQKLADALARREGAAQFQVASFVASTLGVPRDRILS